LGVNTLLVDLDGDQPSILGLPAPADPGVGDWLAAGPGVPVDALAELESEVVEHLSLLHLGDPGGITLTERLEMLAAVLAGSSRSVIVDAGRSTDLGRWWAACDVSVLVIRPC